MIKIYVYRCRYVKEVVKMSEENKDEDKSCVCNKHGAEKSNKNT
jgi:hypothetical protein